VADEEMKKVLGLKTKVGVIKPITFSDDEDALEKHEHVDGDAAGEGTKGGESRKKESRSRRGRKRSRSLSVESAEETSASSSSSASSKSWNSRKQALEKAKEKRGAGFASSDDGSPPLRRRRRLAQVSSSSSEEDNSKEVNDEKWSGHDSPGTHARKVNQLFDSEEQDSDSSPDRLETVVDIEEEEPEDDEKRGSNDFGQEDVVAKSTARIQRARDQRAAMQNEIMIGARVAAGDEDKSNAKQIVDARPSLPLRPDVSHRESLNE
jgi:hypothetical protein